MSDPLYDANLLIVSARRFVVAKERASFGALSNCQFDISCFSFSRQRLSVYSASAGEQSSIL